MDHTRQNLTVTKSNWLVEASYRLDIGEQRLLLTAIAKVDSRNAVPDEVIITAEEYASTFKISMKNAYSQLAAASDNLYERDIKIHDKQARSRTRMRWVSKATYHYGQGKVTLQFAQDVKKYLGEVKSHYTSYKLIQVAGLRSAYSIRMFEMMLQMIDNEDRIGWRVIELSWLRDYLDVDTEYYSKFKYMNAKIIKPAIAEINKSTNLTISYETMKKGRNIYALKFHFIEDDQQKFNFD